MSFFSRLSAKLKCRVAGSCTGCPWIDRNMPDRKGAKRRHVKILWQESSLPVADLGELPIHHIQDFGLRDWADFVFRRQGKKTQIGLLSENQSKVIDVGNCPAVNPELLPLLNWLHKNPPPIGRASFRIRVSPKGDLGIWIDSGNDDLRILMLEKPWLIRLLELAHVELGESRKMLAEHDGELKLNKPFLRPWFSTPLIGLQKEASLYTLAGSLTQPSMIANRHLTGYVMQLAKEAQVDKWLEYGSGCGTFTLPMAVEFPGITATENDSLIRQGLVKGAKVAKLHKKLTVLEANLEKNSEEADSAISEAEALLMVSPKIGLANLISSLGRSENPPGHLLNVCSSTDSFVEDSAKLYGMGYVLRKLQGVDQDPLTPQCTWVSRFERVP
jgi:tRNA/tmRNA/rRNA uracil-C5-methylase (TrmA/RlmC/RlmD family)